MRSHTNFARSLLAAAPEAYSSYFPHLVILAANATNNNNDGNGDDDAYANAKFNPSMAIIIVVLLTAFFFMGFFSIYVRKCGEDSSTIGAGTRGVGTAEGASRRDNANRGLDRTVIESFPVFAYDLVKGLKTHNKEITECAVCLNDFEDEEQLRLLPKCGHAFHPECIDMWLFSHTTCPVCRTNLVPSDISNPTDTDFGIVEPRIEPEEDVPSVTVAVPRDGSFSCRSRSRRDEDSCHGQEEGESVRSTQDLQKNNSVRRSVKFDVQGKEYANEGHSVGNDVPVSKLVRSHSTGHSLVRLRRDMGMGERSTEWFICTPRGLRPATHLMCSYVKVPLHSYSQGPSASSKFFSLDLSKLPFFPKSNASGSSPSNADINDGSGGGSIRRWYERRVRSERLAGFADPSFFARSRSAHNGPPCVFNPPDSGTPSPCRADVNNNGNYFKALKKTLKRLAGREGEASSSRVADDLSHSRSHSRSHSHPTCLPIDNSV
eukprot:TRINITY_DN7034_c0_g1_i1.p1 TRINITY_DN7034_c0_g1~~TRINITY_DN7034_c0_g1_i1.p1  ORF type:complete len:490 (+),score=-23.63 TRINITY_DN7034_c0_g1_i1:251-1720(+)